MRMQYARSSAISISPRPMFQSALIVGCLLLASCSGTEQITLSPPPQRIPASKVAPVNPPPDLKTPATVAEMRANHIQAMEQCSILIQQREQVRLMLKARDLLRDGE